MTPDSIQEAASVWHAEGSFKSVESRIPPLTQLNLWQPLEQRMKNLKLITLALVAALPLAAPTANAITITLGVSVNDPYVLGDVIFNKDGSLIPSGGQAVRDLTMVNTLVGIYNGTTTQIAPYHLSSNNFGAPPLPAAVSTGDIITPAAGIAFAANGNVTITLGTGFTYLIAAYDGQNSGATVWDISSIAAGTVLELPAFAKPNSSGNDLIVGKYGITTWSMFNPITRVPDGASTLAMLGLGLVGLASFRSRFGRK